MHDYLILHFIQVLLILAMFIILITLIRHFRQNKINPFKRFLTGFWIGLVTDALDTLGIGSFATTTTFFKATKLIKDDSKLPGTMTAAHVIPVLFQSLCFIFVVKVEVITLVSMAAAAFLGAFWGSRMTKNWHTPTVQFILGVLLIIAAAIMVFRLVSNPGDNIVHSMHGLHGIWLVLGICFNFIIGILMTMGLGNYAPELIFFSLMGLSPAVAMPVMMLDAAMIMTASSHQFIKDDRVSWEGFAGIVSGGIIGVLLAVLFLTHLHLDALKKVVLLIVIATGIMLIRSSITKKTELNPH
ncbi:sulfite exporter TauE/SafE family protein [Streptococcus pseudoporcinus]|uniref:Membrane protein n=1 Tax=Streptococcus pseudoporcinus TaxID=361101 RepID=A0A4V6L2T8_9STRE|nr:sulfite exporter TauE/SafE family protein [Streptococcus pseudoporcinus]VTS23017.1 membrane protein [Streptococcus pseudoporcinus]VUC70527.1 membrane protein [Streptococcus pseudoporcinus]VUD00375.1 membrane protein [Streptococcus pseudoporcinus]VUD00753.1 membrane protein [Streptococcus pseudoporcinus]